MKKSTIFCTILFLGMTLLILNGCKKQGPAGADGKNGSANVTSSTFNTTSWGWSSPYYYVDLATPELTSANINTAAVMVYFKTTGAWVALPYTQYNSPSQNYIMGFNTSVGNVQVTWFYDTSLSAGSDPNAYYGLNVQLKVVVIPPSVMIENPGLDIRNYTEVKKIMDLND